MAVKIGAPEFGQGVVPVAEGGAMSSVRGSGIAEIGTPES